MEKSEINVTLSPACTTPLSAMWPADSCSCSQALPTHTHRGLYPQTAVKETLPAVTLSGLSSEQQDSKHRSSLLRSALPVLGVREVGVAGGCWCRHLLATAGSEARGSRDQGQTPAVRLFISREDIWKGHWQPMRLGWKSRCCLLECWDADTCTGGVYER